MAFEFKGSWQQALGYISYAQHGEDFLLVNLFRQMKIEKPTYLDLGAHHPIEINNTFMLYERGSNGVLVDANPWFAELCEITRPRDIVLCCGVGPEAGQKPFYMVNNQGATNSFVRPIKETIEKEITLNVRTINEIVAEHCGGVYPDLLHTDIEGLDFEVLKSADFSKSKPKVICTENKDDGVALKELLAPHGFECLIRVCENLIFVQKEYLGVLK